MLHKEYIVEVDPALLEDEVEPVINKEDMTPVDRAEHSVVLSMLLGALGFGYIIHYFLNGGSLGLSSINMIFLFAAIILHKTPANFLRAVNEAIRNTGGIVLPFPLYAGIMGMMVQSGLATSISQWFVEVSTGVDRSLTPKSKT
jgi:short-chain fatty acids transporter